MRFFFSFLILAGCAVSIVSGSSNDPSVWGNLPLGSYGVGFRIVREYDHTRTYIRKFDYRGNFRAGERARPVTIGIWYPSDAQQSGIRVTLGGYVELSSEPDRMAPLNLKEKKTAVERFLGKTFGENYEKFWKTSFLAKKDIPPLEGRFPLVLVAQGDARLWPLEDFSLCEYLASHGFVVLSTPSIEEDGTLSQRYAFRQWNIILQMQDLQFLFGYSRRLPYIDPDRMAVAARDMGGLAAALFSMYNYDTDALISLNSRLGNRYGYAMLFKSSIYTPSIVHTPLLHILPAESHEDTDIGFFESLKYADVYLLKVKGASADDLSSLGDLRQGAGGAARSHGNVRYDYVLRFLNAVVNRDAAAQALLRESPDPDMAKVEYQKGRRRPPLEEEFVALLRESGVSAAADVYRDIADYDPEHNIANPATLIAVANEWMSEGKANEAIQLLQLNSEMYPDYWLVYDALGNMYLQSGDTSHAVESFERSLEMNPDNRNAKEALEKLSVSAGD